MSDLTGKETVIEVYDPAMCCSTGVCGPDVNDELADFANDLKWLKSQGVSVSRFNLSQEPEAFKASALVLGRLQREGSGVLPVILVNGEMVAEGGYPDRKTLMDWCGLGDQNGQQSHPTKENKVPAFNETTEIFVVIGAAMASGSESALRAAFARGNALGIQKEEMVKAMKTGLEVRQGPLADIVDSANQLLGIEPQACAPGGGCC